MTRRFQNETVKSFRTLVLRGTRLLVVFAEVERGIVKLRCALLQPRQFLYNHTSYGDSSMRIAVDTGGTFTDCIFVREGELRILKVPSTPENPARAIGEAVRKVLAESPTAAKERLEVTCGTTVGTNALLQRRGGRVALVTTAGFEDVLEIGRQARPQLYDFFGG